jgi:hypothetical protein
MNTIVRHLQFSRCPSLKGPGLAKYLRRLKALFCFSLFQLHLMYPLSKLLKYVDFRVRRGFCGLCAVANSQLGDARLSGLAATGHPSCAAERAISQRDQKA